MKKILIITLFTSLVFLGCKKDPPEQVGQPAFSSLSVSILTDTLDVVDTVPLVKYQWVTSHAQGVSFDGVIGGALPPSASKIFPAKWGDNAVKFNAIGKIIITDDFPRFENITDTILTFHIDSSMVFQ